MDVILLYINSKYKVCRFNRYGQLFGENLNDVMMMSLPNLFLLTLDTNRPRVYLSDIPNFNLIKHKRADIHREVNREL